ncbi:hypothetical protein AB0M95_39525 [Sphaerisporangium sp. NPDC051017]|uniref:hypothetical protein n=1 Tax=Sphaerisporangium sp. NPDC051017 TaxID=3154636 RepID=UPI003421AF7E
MTHANVPGRQLRASRRHQLRVRGLTWEQIADVWEADHPEIGPRVAFRWAHDLSLEAVSTRWNQLDPGEATMTKSRIYQYECWPAATNGRRPSVAALSMLARIYQTTGRRLLTSDEYGRYTLPSQREIDGIDHRMLDDNQGRQNTRIGQQSVELNHRPSEMSDVEVTGGSARTKPHADELSPRLEEILRSWDELMRRRDIFTLTGGMAVTALAPTLTAGLSLPEFDRSLYATCAQLTATYRRLDNLLGPYAVYDHAIAHHQRLTTWLQHATKQGERKHLSVLTVDAGGLTSWLLLDLEQYDRAFALARQAVAVARDHDHDHDTGRQAYLVGRMSRILFECSRYQDALELADEAVQLAGTKAAPAVLSWLAVTRAYIHACLNNDRACREDLDMAARLLQRAAGEPVEDYLAFHDQGHLYKMQGLCLLKLGEHSAKAVGEGRHAIDRAFEVWPQTAVRASAEVLAARASARLAQREIPQAASLTGQAYTIAMRTRSPRNLRAVSNLRLRLRPYRHTDAVRDLDDQMAL